jgi:hypothetical protein
MIEAVSVGAALCGDAIVASHRTAAASGGGSRFLRGSVQ